ncbi:MAG: tetratricopeptide repeat protein [Verrucomicrobia bacterium]|nr:tetratricopeptide repeat protein [Verrucomicrobiota bacterium]
MLHDEFGENRLAAWFRGLTMTARIQIVLFSLVGTLLAVIGGIALIEQPAILLPVQGPDAKPVPGEPTNRPAAPNEAKLWRRAEGLMAQGAGTAMTVESKGEIEAMRKLVNLKPDDADGWDRLGKSLYLAGIYDEAVKVFRKALELSPGNKEVLVNLGVTLKTKGELTEYEKVVDEVIRLDAALGRELMNFSPQKSVAETSRAGSPSSPASASTVPPQTPIADSIPGGKNKVSPELRVEIDAMRRLVAMDEKDAGNWDGLGKVLYRSAQYEEAVKCFRRSLDLQPGVQDVLANLGVALKTKGDMAQYQQVLDQLTSLNAQMGDELKKFPVPVQGSAP